MSDRTRIVREAADLLGGQRELGRELDVSDRFVRYLLAGEKSASDGIMTDTAAALERRAGACADLAARIRASLGAAGEGSNG